MKFAKELEQELVPEWRAKYLNYKLGKKKIKAIARALRAIEQAPRTPGRRGFLSGHDGTPRIGRPALPQFGPYRGSRSKDRFGRQSSYEETDILAGPANPYSQDTPFPERRPLKSPSRFADCAGGYGSIVTPQSNATRSTGLPSLELPDPALDPNEANFPPCTRMVSANSLDSRANPTPGRGRGRWNLQSSILPGSRNVFRPRGGSVPPGRLTRRRSFLQRMFTSRVEHESPSANPPAEAFLELRNRETEFFDFLDKELVKIESFYRLKEEEATERLRILKEQLHVMRDMRLEELRAKARLKHQGGPSSDMRHDTDPAAKWTRPLSKSLNGLSKYDKISKELAELPTPGSTLHRTRNTENYRDFVRRQENDVPYRSAKRKLKTALLEFYRGLELLKAYAYLNRKAFRKMNKKYDKATNVRPTGRYMSEKVNNAWFVQSDLVESHLVAVEDLYTRYFERGNRKVAVTKLRGKAARSLDYSPNSFRNGLLFAAGLVFGIQGLVHAVGHLFNQNDDDDYDFDDLHVQTSYLLQIYGGYTLILLHFIFFCLNCRVWTRSKINYVFVFEYDTRHVLDWRQLAEIPCFLVFLLGLVIWLNFRWVNEIGGCCSQGCTLWSFEISSWEICIALKHMPWACSILYYMTLSLYRINKIESLRATFIVFALVNAIYSSIWDVAMDWSLGNPFSRNPFLRDSLGFRKRWVYYMAMIIDPILRFNWIFYAIFTHDVQHSAILSFLVSLSEVCRRGIWSIFRVENEHCTNVSRFRASRDVPLPYDLPSDTFDQHSRPFESTTIQQAAAGVPIAHLPPATPATGVDVERLAADNTTPSGMRHRHGTQPSETPGGTLARVGTMLANAHAEDFERRKRPGVVGSTHDHDKNQAHSHGHHDRDHGHGVHRRDSSTDDEEEEEEDDDDDDDDEGVVESESEENGSNELDDPRIIEGVDGRFKN
ncbi:conserved hypothetical protein [Uncinocarpus reesii 1704]|uniref:Uncharacterized protein n=1 Tax=Uncinocarpus reesii (strain UAMH 1704) TaxID=336963 RepID=C4JLR2_UNCRE|nr:uncharacterized protein UREG_03770 [Uncinocarpus reesii 1704]EEP78924.1 conserved hypothetical protein [Uncinocarpus reesii 1704]